MQILPGLVTLPEAGTRPQRQAHRRQACVKRLGARGSIIDGHFKLAESLEQSGRSDLLLRGGRRNSNKRRGEVRVAGRTSK